MANDNSSIENEYKEISTRETDNYTEKYPKWKIWKKRRYVIALLSSLGSASSYLLRANMSIAVVAMTQNGTTIDQYGNLTYVKGLDWNLKMQGFLLSSFFYGYVATQLLGGWLSLKIGGKRVSGFAISGAALVTLMMPYATRKSYYLLFCLRILTGAFAGCTYSCIFAILSRWAPPMERSKLVSLTMMGNSTGTIFAIFAGAHITQKFGWETFLYVSGALPLLWVTVWCTFVSDSPSQDRFISSEELKYIKTAVGEQVSKKNLNHSWKSILTSMPLLACILANFADGWEFFTMLTQLPIFMKNALNFDLGETGIMSAMPYIGRLVVMFVSGFLADYCNSKKFLSTTNVRKLFTCSGLLLEATFLLIAACVMSPTGTTLCITLGVALGGFAFTGFGANYLDMAPQHASITTGIGNFLAVSSGIISPILTGFIVTTGSVREWQTVFCIGTGLSLVSAIVYGCMASAELQDWAKTPESVKLLPIKNEKKNIVKEPDNSLENF